MTGSELGAVVLAGGRSRRFGERDKALARVGGEAMLVRVVDRVGAATGEVVVSCRHDQRLRFEDLDFGTDVRFVVDPEPDEGPLAGLAAALPAVEAPLVAVVACDMPGVDPAVLEAFADAVGDQDGAVPCLPDGSRQPLQAVYRTEALRRAVSEELESDGRSVRGAVDRLDLEMVSPSAVADPARTLANVNTPEDVDRFRRGSDRESDGAWEAPGTLVGRGRTTRSMADEIDDPEELPAAAGEFAEEYREVWEEYADLGEACSEAGPVDDETKRLVKLALAIGDGSEGAVHSHVRRGLEEGIPPETLKHAAVLSIPTIGFPNAIAALSWIEDETE